MDNNSLFVTPEAQKGQIIADLKTFGITDANLPEIDFIESLTSNPFNKINLTLTFDKVDYETSRKLREFLIDKNKRINKLTIKSK